MYRWDDAETSANKGDRDNYNSIRWTPLNGLMLKVLYGTSPISMQCNQSDGTRFPVRTSFLLCLYGIYVHLLLLRHK